ncbi:MAG: pirin family protein [Planctomycetota bacterium]|nr:pirin family protein [Planctomycetota bacterium]
MVTVRSSEARGAFNFGWLDTKHTFSFGEYHDPEHMRFSALRVINEDVVAPGQGFGRHPHREMEIITYVLSGALRHEDSSGGGGVMRPGDVQRMSAGTGVTHSEFNDSDTEPVHLLQIWIRPNVRDVPPRYGQISVPEHERQGRLRVVASPDGREGSLPIYQDATVMATLLAPGESVTHNLPDRRSAWVQVARGEVTLNGQTLRAGDGAGLTGERAVTLRAVAPAEVLVFDLP